VEAAARDRRRPALIPCQCLGVTIVPFRAIGSVLYRGREKPSTWQYNGYTCMVGVLLHTRTRTRTGLHTLTLNPFGDFLSTTNNVRPTQGVAAAAARRRHGLEVEDEGLLKDLFLIFIFLKMFCTVRYFF
jgi:hypothetical protein